MAEFRILIVDEQHDVRRMLQSRLESLGLTLHVTGVPSGEEALLVLSRQSFHLLITNTRLAGMSGLELLPKARRRQPELKTILVAGNSDAPSHTRAQEAGADRLLQKPVEVDELVSAVKQVLGLEQAANPETSARETEAETEEQPQATLAERLALLRKDLNAISVSLLDDNGRIVAQAGDWPSGTNLTVLIPSLMGVFSAGVKVAHLLHVEHPDDMFFFAGRGYDLALAHVGDLAVLLVMSPKGIRDRVGDDLLRIVRQAAVDVLQILQGIGLVVSQPADMPEVPPAMEAEGDADEDEDLGELEAILQTGVQQRLDTDDLDEFWAAVADEFPEEKAPGTGELSYDQARQIGLTPEESLESPAG